MCVLTKKALCNWESKNKSETTQNNSENLEKLELSSNDQRKEFEPPKKKNKIQFKGFKEDPYIYFNVDEPLYKEISEYYGLTVCVSLPFCIDFT